MSRFQMLLCESPPGLGEVLGAAFFKATLLSSLLHWAFYIFSFELRTMKDIGLDDLGSNILMVAQLLFYLRRVRAREVKSV